MNRIIKMEEEEFPLNSPEYDNAFFNHCLTTFYDHDSNDEIIQAKYSAQEVLFYLENNIDVCDTPLSEIMKIVSSNVNFKGVDIAFVKNKIIKQKSFLKRERAKHRKILIRQKRTMFDLAIVNAENDDQYKKQRNRISAQISRDRKKQKVKDLQEMNKQLQMECQYQKQINEKLTKQIQANKQRELKWFGQPLKSKFTKLFIMLGIIFLFGIIKDIFTSNSQLSTLNTFQNQFIDLNRQQESSFLPASEEQKLKIYESVESSLTEVVEDKGFLSKIKTKVAEKLTDWDSTSRFIPTKLKQQIRMAKQYALSL